MAEFSKLTITDKGRALIAKVVAGTAETQFTKVCTSSFQYENEMLESLTEISDIKQTSLISNVKRTSDSQIIVEVGFTNVELTSGYYIRALGLYALDPDEGEILYGVTLETSGECHMPAYNGVTVGGAIMRFSTAVGNAEKVSLEVDPGAFVTMSQFEGHTHTPAEIGAAPAYSMGTEDLTAGSSALENGKLYFVYE